VLGGDRVVARDRGWPEVVDRGVDQDRRSAGKPVASVVILGTWP